jgi:hypothetical protein
MPSHEEGIVVDHEAFDRLVRLLGQDASRRAAAATVATLAAAGLAGLDGAMAKKKRKKKKCAKAGQIVGKKRKRCCRGLVKTASGRCKRRCGGCTGATVCVGGECLPCDVCASGCAFSALQPAVEAASPGATLHLCAGLYAGDVVITKSLSLIGAGAGSGDGNTILDGSGTDHVVDVLAGSTVSLRDLRITGGGSFGEGGGLRNDGGIVSVTDCAITANTANRGGGIGNRGTLTLTNTTVTGNTAADVGGGIYNSLNDTVTLDAASRVTGNGADLSDPDSGGGIHNAGGAVTLSTASNVTGNSPDNCGGDPVPLCAG